jgi:multicomponent Na+:H+ antiporter subunit D
VTAGREPSLTLLTVLVLPVIAATVTAFARDRPRAMLGVVAGSLSVLAVARLSWLTWTKAIPTRLTLEGPADLALSFVADGLAVAMLLMTALTFGAVAIFGADEDITGPRERHRLFWPTWFSLWASLQVLFLAGDLLTAYLMLEAVGVTGAGLVMLDGDRRTLRAGVRYFYAELVASTTVLVGIALVWRETGSLAFDAIGPDLVASPTGWLALSIISTGLLLKVPLVPIHVWLPSAHALAPGAVSPILSAVVVKSAFALLVRLWMLSAPELVTRAAAQLLGALGVLAIIWGSVLALRAVHVKRLVAYSTVAQLGFLFLLVPLVQAGALEAWQGGVLYAIAHALAKAALLMAAAVLVEDAGRPDVTALPGAAARCPLAVFAIGISALSLVGLPPSGGFVAKWYLLVASLRSGQWWWLPPILLGSLLTAAYLLRLIKPAFDTTSTDPATSISPTTTSTLPTTTSRRGALALGLALTTVVLGLRPTELLELLGVGGPSPLSGGG